MNNYQVHIIDNFQGGIVRFGIMNLDEDTSISKEEFTKAGCNSANAWLVQV